MVCYIRRASFDVRAPKGEEEGLCEGGEGQNAGRQRM